jgi:hypothetical protein
MKLRFALVSLLFSAQFLVAGTNYDLYDHVVGVGKYEDHALNGQGTTPESCASDLAKQVAVALFQSPVDVVSVPGSSAFSSDKYWVSVQTPDKQVYTVTLRTHVYDQHCYVDTTYSSPLYVEDSSGHVVVEIQGETFIDRTLGALFSHAFGGGNPALP